MGKTSNRLRAEKSPYLLQHAYNPVDWYPWGTEPFDRARQEDKPIFLSIGYSTCHWCHVMAHESFENPVIAKLLNSWFISIKVDREERPDIDQMYMAATHLMAGSGGWPMSVFLLPDGSPFYAGSYFPRQSSFQRPGFADLLTALHTAWQQNRGEIRQTAKQLVARLAEEAGPEATMPADGADRCFNLLAESYDGKEGGFGDAPKFPRPAVFTFLFSWYQRSGVEAARAMALHTLRKMAAGGMYDQLGGGFHRYSVDAHWFVPHFEKMLYDQGQLANAYLDAFLLTSDHGYARVAREILAYVVRDMQAPGGGFYSAEDADSVNPYAPAEHGEGAFYLWREEELRERLGPDSAALFCYVHGVQKDGNVSQDPLGEFTGRNILHRACTAAEAAVRFALEEREVESRLTDARLVLLEARSERVRPHLDDKIITGWNGLLISALARGSEILRDPELLEPAVRAATFIKDTLYDTGKQTLLRRYRDGEAGLAGQLDDYGNLVDGLLNLYQVSQDPIWLQWAESLTEQQIRLFWHESGGYFYDSAADPSLKLRMRGMYDGAEPAANSVAAHNLLRLSRLRARPEWHRTALRLMESFAGIIAHYPPALPLMLSAWQHRETSELQVVVAGRRGQTDTNELLRVALCQFDPHRLVLLADGRENQKYLAERLPFVKSITRPDDRAMAYVCVDCSCRRPTHDPEELRHQLAEATGGGLGKTS